MDAPSIYILQICKLKTGFQNALTIV